MKCLPENNKTELFHHANCVFVKKVRLLNIIIFCSNLTSNKKYLKSLRYSHIKVCKKTSNKK